MKITDLCHSVSQKIAIRYIVILIVVIMYGHVMPVKAEEPISEISVETDFARFKYDSSRTLLEIYYFVYMKSSDYSSIHDVIIDFELLNATGDSVLGKQSLPVPFSADKQNNSAGKIGQIKVILPEGNYHLKFTYNSDVEPSGGKSDSIIDKKIIIEPFNTSEVCLSDIQLCKNIIVNSPNQESPFYKNTMEVIPNPTLRFGKESPALYYYMELYNLSKYAGKEITIIKRIKDLNGQIVKMKTINRKYSSDSAVERGVFPVHKLMSGWYKLEIQVKNEKSEIVDLKVRDFYVSGVIISEENKQPSVRRGNSRFMDLTSAQLDTVFLQSAYIATENEKKIYENFTDKNGKWEFLIQFWDKRNKLYGKEFEALYFQRVEYVNQLFNASFKKGWQTERGRVYILYGPPNEIERPVLGENTKVEIWHYHDIQGGVEFDFVDFSGFGDYNLLNSNHPKEDLNEDWKEYLK